MEMDERAMMDWPLIPFGLSLPLAFAGGVALGFAYFSALRMTATLIVRGGSPLLGLAMALGRLAVLGAGFYLAVQAGALALLAAFSGVMLAKALILRHTRREGA
ncbi:MAG: ATP synthase subunit I [Roseovarius sp.]|nr:ATP synthase subunit I [Roseovarius sp.]